MLDDQSMIKVESRTHASSTALWLPHPGLLPPSRKLDLSFSKEQVVYPDLTSDPLLFDIGIRPWASA